MMYTNRLLALAVALAGTACNDYPINVLDRCPIEGEGVCLRGEVLDLGTGEADCGERIVQLVELHPRIGPHGVKVLAETQACEDGSFEMMDVPLPVGDRYLVVSEDGTWPAVATPLGRRASGGGPGEWLRGTVAWSVDAELGDEIVRGLELAGEESNIYATGAVVGFVESELGNPIDGVEVSCNYCDNTYYFDTDERDGLFTDRTWLPLEPWNDVPRVFTRTNSSTSADAGAMFLVPVKHEVYLDAFGAVPYGFEETYVETVPGMLTVTRIEGRPFVHPLDEDLLP